MDATLVLVGHGSNKNSDSCQAVYHQAAALRKAIRFAEVREAFVKQEPGLIQVLSEIQSRRVFVVPLFISEGYFTQRIIPRLLGLDADEPSAPERYQPRGQQLLHYCPPVGAHPRMTNVLLERARDIVQRFPFPTAPVPRDTALFVVGHGTPKDPRSRLAVEREVTQIQAMNLYAEVHSIFIEEEPLVSDCYQLARSRNLVVVPFFISEGLHTREDIPRMLGEAERDIQARLGAGQPTWRNPTEREGKRVWYTASIGMESLIADIILERVREAASFQGNRSGA